MNRAFTLIELITVIVIITIISAVALPSLGMITNARSAGAAQTLAAHLEYTRELAFNAGLRAWVVIDVTNDTAATFANAEGTDEFAQATPATDPRSGFPMTLSLNTGDYVGVTITSAAIAGGTTVGFDWLGTPIDTAEQPLLADGVITLSGGPRVFVHAVTGNIQVQ